MNFFRETSCNTPRKNICAPFYPKVATRTNFSKHFAAAKAEMGHRNFPRLAIYVGLAIYACLRRMQVCKLFLFFFLQPPRSAWRWTSSNLAYSRKVTRESHVLRSMGRMGKKRWLQENATRRRLRVPMGRIKWEGKKRKRLQTERTFRRASRLHNISRRRLWVRLNKRDSFLDPTWIDSELTARITERSVFTSTYLFQVRFHY